MARYAVIADLPRVVQNLGLTSDDMNKALDSASAEADGYLATQFTLPLAQWGADLRKHVANMAAYTVASDRGLNLDDPANENIRKRNDGAIAWLRDVSKGLVVPAGYQDSAPAADGISGEDGPMVMYPERPCYGEGDLDPTTSNRSRGF